MKIKTNVRKPARSKTEKRKGSSAPCRGSTSGLTFFGTRLGAECPGCDRNVGGRVGQITKCKCGLLLRRSDCGEWASCAPSSGSGNYVIQLRGGTTLKMPAGRGPNCVYDLLLGVLAQSKVKVKFYPTNEVEWQPGENAIIGAEYCQNA